VGILDCAKNQRRHHGVGAGVVERKLLSGSLYDRDVQGQAVGTLSEFCRHAWIRFSQKEF
jgi:hypothetical protein